MSRRRRLEEKAAAYLIIGDLDKPFHRPECPCELCDKWREEKGRPTFEYLRKMLAHDEPAQETIRESQLQ
jgi:hypothetical protein